MSTPRFSQYDAIIIGAGHNGLVCAAYLARAGRRVLVLERREVIGGACATEEIFPGFYFSSCAFLCYALQPKIARDLELRRHGLQVYDLDPLEFRPFPDGRHLILRRNTSWNVEQIRRFSDRDAAAYPGWNALWRRANAIVEPFVLREPPTYPELFRRAQELGEEELLTKIMTTGYADLLDEYFESDIVKAALVHSGDTGDPRGIGSAYPAANISDDASDVGNLIGIVRGGMGAISRAIATAAEGSGAEIHLGLEVQRVLVAGGQARGVVLVDGTMIGAPIVVSNADPKRTYLKLIGTEHLSDGVLGRVRRLRTKVGYLKLHAALRELPDFSHYLGSGSDPKTITRVWINPSVAYYERAWHDALNGRPSERPVMSVQIPSTYDESVCPPGTHTLSIFAQYAPVQLAEGTWEERRAEVGELLIDTLSAYAPNFRRAIIDWCLFTPYDIEQRVGMTDGNIHHIDMIPGQMFASRPFPGYATYETPIPGLWLCGAGTHPGGEVSGAPGHNAAQAILRAAHE
jgi:phytoene dehydrogenase-like protein